MPVERFLRNYWHKHPLLIRNAFADFQSPLQPEDLAGLACEDGVLARLISHDRATDGWDVRTGPFQETDFPACPTMTGPCWYRTWTSGTPTCARCWNSSASCHAGASTTS